MQEGLPVSFWKFVAGANAGVLPGAAAGCDGSMPCALWNFYRNASGKISVLCSPMNVVGSIPSWKRYFIEVDNHI